MIQKLFIFTFINVLSFSLAKAATLEEAFRSALQNNETANQSRQSLIQTRLQEDQAKSTLYPTLSLEASHRLQPKPDDPIAAEFSPETQTTTNLHLTQPLFRGFREFAALKQRRSLVRAGEQMHVSTLLNLYELVADKYLGVLSAEQDLKNLSEQKVINAQRSKDLEARRRRGEARLDESLSAQSSEAAVDAEMYEVQARLKAAREDFAFLTGLPVETPLTDEDLEIKMPQSLQSYLDRIEQRPDLKSAHEQVKATESEVSIAKGAHWPTIDAIGNYYLRRPDGFLSDVKWDVEIKLSLPLFEGGLRTSQVSEAASRKTTSELELHKVRRQAAGHIRSLYEQIKARIEQLAALKRSAGLAENSYQSLQKDFRRGLARNIDVQLALADYRKMLRMYDQARYSARLDMIRLENAAFLLPPSIVKEL